MSMDLEVKKITKNAYRITKKRGKTALRVRVPGGHLDVKYLPLIQTIAEKFGNGTVHMTTRQGFEIPDIDYKHMDEINKMIEPIIKGIEIDGAGIEIQESDIGYPAAGTRNISACIGNRVCQFANLDTSSFALKVEKTVFPNNDHVKIAITGCPNDCIKAHMQDFGIIGISQTDYDEYKCVGCERCVITCKKKVTGALTLKNNKVIKDQEKCIGCGECATVCPAAAFTRNPQKYFRLVIMGRTGRKNPRIARPFLNWVTEDVVLKVLSNTYKYIDKYIDRTLPKEHVGYIVDRTGYEEFKKCVLEGIELNEKAQVASNIEWGGYTYKNFSTLE